MEAISGERQETISILGIPGAVSTRSLNVELLGNAAREAPDDARLTIYLEPGLLAMPPFEPGAAPSAEVERLREAVDEADAVVVATPEYNGSIPGGLKNAIDWIADDQAEESRPLAGKPAVVIGADPGRFGCDWAVADARKVLEVAGARVLPAGLAIGRARGRLRPRWRAARGRAPSSARRADGVARARGPRGLAPAPDPRALGALDSLPPAQPSRKRPPPTKAAAAPRQSRSASAASVWWSSALATVRAPSLRRKDAMPSSGAPERSQIAV